jgi:nicotinamide-nucleotide amidase
VDNDKLLALSKGLGQALQARKLMLAVAESCTGGMLAQYVTAIAGSSVWFERGFVTYSNVAKQEMLGVNAQTLIDFGAVSQEVATEMAQGACLHSHAQMAVAITGIAGPDGGMPGKPVGTVCFGFSYPNQSANQENTQQTITQTMHFAGNRDAVRQQSVIHALETLITLTLSLDLWNN